MAENKQKFRIGTFDFQLRGLSIISEADAYRFFMRPHFAEAHGNVAPNLGDYGVACHTSEAPGLPALQGRLPSPQDGRITIRLLPLAGLLLRRADMMDKVVHIMDTLPLCAHPGHAALAAPKPLMTSFLSSVSSSALCVWSSHPHGAFFCRPFPVSAITSLQVAEISGKRHDHVLREIEYILTQPPEIFVELNFEEYEAAY